MTRKVIEAFGGDANAAPSRSDESAGPAKQDAPVTPCNSTGIREETARELLAVEYDRAGYHRPASRVRQGQFDDFDTAAIRAILSALGPPPTEVREGVESTACPECGGSVFGAHVLDSKGQPVCGAMPATPPMRDREAIARLIARHSDVYEGMWPEHLGAADAILSLSPSPCDCLVREALEQIVAKDAEHEPDLGLLRHDFQTGFKGGVRWCAGIARTALQSHRGDENG